jgi:histone-lysine N-methyltransferase SETMAR
MKTPNHTHTANMTKAAIQEHDWEIPPHPPYSSDLAAPDYYLFRFLSNNLRGVSFNNDAELQNWLDDFFTAKPAYFFKRGIEHLPERWERVVTNGRGYIID